MSLINYPVLQRALSFFHGPWISSQWAIDLPLSKYYWLIDFFSYYWFQAFSYKNYRINRIKIVIKDLNDLLTYFNQYNINTNINYRPTIRNPTENAPKLLRNWPVQSTVKGGTRRGSTAHHQPETGAHVIPSNKN